MNITIKNIQKGNGARSIVCDIYDDSTAKCFAKSARFNSISEATADLCATFGTCKIKAIKE